MTEIGFDFLGEMPLTGEGFKIEPVSATDSEIQTEVQSLVIDNIFGFSVVPISNTQDRLIIVHN